MMDNQQFRELYDTYYASIANFVCYSIGRGIDVDDVIQNVFVKVARNYSQFGRHSSVKTWIISIARNEIIDNIRKAQRLPHIQPGEIADTIVGSVRDPQEIVSDRDTLSYIRKQVEALPLNMRSVVLLRLYQDLNTSETAEVMGWSAVRVRVTYKRALDKLRRSLQPGVHAADAFPTDTFGS
jgi:RNA polymerase sigma-70 factor, ECF subfamily